MPESGRPRVLIVRNYAADRQESMLRFAAALEAGLRSAGYSVSVISPPVVAGRMAGRSGSLRKWLGYLDKYVLFPWLLRAAVRTASKAQRVVVHICDHSNAVYTKHLQDVPHVVTCNDMLAVRSALGEFPQNPTRRSGRVLQAMILDGLRRAQYVACISAATRADLLRLSGLPAEDVSVVYMGRNYEYGARPNAPAEVRALLGDDVMKGSGHEGRRYILHVGGNQWYKNRLVY